MGTQVETNNQLPTTKPTTNNAQDEEFSDPRISQHCSGQARPWRCSPRSSSCCPPSTRNSSSCCPPSTRNSPPRCPLSSPAHAAPGCPPPCCPPPTCPP